MKTFVASTGQKVFINVCGSEKIDPPSRAPSDQGMNSAGMKIPLSLGPIRNENDGQGKVCKVVDIVFNPSAIENPKYKKMLIDLAMEYVQEKYKDSLKKGPTSSTFSSPHIVSLIFLNLLL